MSKFSKALVSLMLAAGVMTSMMAVSADETAEDVAAADEEIVEEVEYADAPVFQGYAVNKITFDGVTEVPFSLSSNVASAVIEDGVLVGESNGGDPYMNYTGAVAMNAADVDYIIIRIAMDSAATNGQLFFTTETIGWSEAASIKFDTADMLTDAEGFYNIVLTPAECAEWKGTINGLRLDPLTAEGTFKLDSIVFWTTETQVFKLDFADMTKAQFSASGDVSRLVVHDGFLMAMSIGGDPYISTSGLSINAEAAAEMTLKIKARFAENTNAQIFFTTETIGWSEAASFKVDLSTCEIDENGFYNVVIDTATCAEWKGTVTGLRIDPAAGKGSFIIGPVYFNAAEYVVTDEIVEDAEEVIDDVENITEIDFLKLFALGYFN